MAFEQAFGLLFAAYGGDVDGLSAHDYTGLRPVNCRLRRQQERAFGPLITAFGGI